MTADSHSPEELAVAGYVQALRHVLEREEEEAFRLLHATWRGRDDVDAASDAFSAVLAAGVGVAAHTLFFDDEDAAEERRAILAELERHEDRLDPPARTVYDHLRGETDATPGDLLAPTGYDRAELAALDEVDLATPDDTAPNAIGDSAPDAVDDVAPDAIGDSAPDAATADDAIPDPATASESARDADAPPELDGDELEALAFARLLDALQADPESTEELVEEGYARALRHVLEGEGGEALEVLHAVWEVREEVDEETDAFAQVLAAGVGLAAHMELSGVEGTGAEKAAILETVEPDRDRLPDAVAPVLEHLADGGTDATPADLVEPAVRALGDDVDPDTSGLASTDAEATDLDTDDVDPADIDPTDLDVDPTTLDTVELEALAFATLLDRLTADPESPEAIAARGYDQALQLVLVDEVEDALELLRAVWEGRVDVDAASDAFSAVLAAGVGVAVHTLFFDDEDAAEERRAILAELDRHEDRLDPPARTVYDHLRGETEATPGDLLEPSEHDLDDLPALDPTTLDTEDLEALAFARLLEAALVDPELAVAGYDQALRHVLEGETEEALRTLQAVWQERDDVDEGADAFPTVLAAGVGVAVHTLFFDDEDVAEERRAILAELERYEDRLDPPVRTVYDHVRGGTEATPEDLLAPFEHDLVDVVVLDPDDLDTEDLEALAFAHLLDAVTSDPG